MKKLLFISIILVFICSLFINSFTVYDNNKETSYVFINDDNTTLQANETIIVDNTSIVYNNVESVNISEEFDYSINKLLWINTSISQDSYLIPSKTTIMAYFRALGRVITENDICTSLYTITSLKGLKLNNSSLLAALGRSP